MQNGETDLKVALTVAQMQVDRASQFNEYLIDKKRREDKFNDDMHKLKDEMKADIEKNKAIQETIYNENANILANKLSIMETLREADKELVVAGKDDNNNPILYTLGELTMMNRIVGAGFHLRVLEGERIAEKWRLENDAKYRKEKENKKKKREDKLFRNELRNMEATSLSKSDIQSYMHRKISNGIERFNIEMSRLFNKSYIDKVWDKKLKKYVRVIKKGENLYGTYDAASQSVITNNRYSVDRSQVGYTKEMSRRLNYSLNLAFTAKPNKFYDYFDRLYSVSVNRELTSLCQYVFITRPDLHIFEKGNDFSKLLKYNTAKEGNIRASSSPSTDPEFTHLAEKFPYIIKYLSHNATKSHHFIPFLTGKALSLQVPDYTIESGKMHQQYTGVSMPFASHNSGASTGGTFDIEFKEDRYLRMHMFFNAWVTYINNVTINKFRPKRKYIKRNRFDYTCSVYCITCAPDAETILYWTKYTGCFPTAVPHSDFSFNLRGQAKNTISIPFQYFRSEALNLEILQDFNYNAKVPSDVVKFKEAYNKSQNVYSKMTTADIFHDYDEKKIALLPEDSQKLFKEDTSASIMGTGSGLVGKPFIVKLSKTDGSYPDYKLVWTGPNIKDMLPD